MHLTTLLPRRAQFGVLCFGLGLTGLTIAAQAQPDAATPAAAPAKSAAKPAKARKPRVTGTSHLRVLHAIPGGPSVDVYLDGKKTLEGVTFKTLSAYMDVPSGSHTLALRPAGSAATVAPLATLRRSVAPDAYFVAAAASVAGKPTILVQNETSGKLNPKKASVRFYHLSPDAPAVSITAPSTSKRAANGTRNVVKLLPPGKNRAATLNGGSVTLSIRAEDKVVKEVPVSVEAGNRYAAFAVGRAAGTGEEALEVILKPAGK